MLLVMLSGMRGDLGTMTAGSDTAVGPDTVVEVDIAGIVVAVVGDTADHHHGQLRYGSSGSQRSLFRRPTYQADPFVISRRDIWAGDPQSGYQESHQK